MNNLYLLNLYFLPLLYAFVFSLFKFKESTIRNVSIVCLSIPFITSLAIIFRMVFINSEPISAELLNLQFEHHHISFSIYIDKLSCVILFLTGYLSVVVARLSQVYLHRERGYQRFFKTINLFVFGLQVLALAGTLDLFFAGWEIVGFSSFLLIAFYRNRTRPVKNAFRVYSIYRIADFGLLLGAIVGHVLLKNADHFNILQSQNILLDSQNSGWIIVLSLMLVFAAIGKSAQFPFLNWPARAMEGPTPSSAIFYGALSIHCGVFLLYRTYPIWGQSQIVVSVIVAIALLTIVLASGIGRVQSNIKGQLAYASVTQISIMFIEVALGLHTLVLFHIISHCLLRCYQLLVSPSIIVEHLKTINKDDVKLSKISLEMKLPIKLRNTLYSIMLQEGFISVTERGMFILPAIYMKLLARRVSTSLYTFVFLLLVLGGFAWLLNDLAFTHLLAYFYAAVALIVALNCLTSLEQPQKIWNRFGLSQAAFLIAIYAINPESMTGVFLYLLSALPCWLCGFFALNGLANVDMKIYNGVYGTAKYRATLFLVAFVGLSGLPFTTAFWAEDILIAEIILINPPILILTTITLMLNGLIAARILVKTFWGFPTYIEA